MTVISEIRKELGNLWPPMIYEFKVRPGRTRSMEMDIPARENRPEILRTLLGFELKVGNIRISCPDIAIARYLSFFARIGVCKVAVPYDITKIAGLAGELDAAWETTIAVFERFTKGQSPQQKGRIRAAIIREMRSEIDRIGAGELMPLFNKSTKQRNN
ncbi:MAG: hypothetical protein ACT4O9_05260 [Blastocatellia bacterium]